jgi:hypothetical protein
LSPTAILTAICDRAIHDRSSIAQRDDGDGPFGGFVIPDARAQDVPHVRSFSYIFNSNATREW